ncbi:unnamed protein product [Prorocentrum cordatum]|uniref:RNA-directed RNA polymerase n=1 Tax=Prorocentrum cordatum TaxID=2364126 RepID=A0ABN9PEW4_9DINO|nr:unnamed protein product [Polarella glacialis]
MQWQAPPNLPLWLVLWLQLGEFVQEKLSQAVRERECPAWEPAAQECPAPAPEPPAGWERGPLLWWAGQVLGGAAWHVWQARRGQEFWREAAVGSRARVSYSDDDVDHERHLLWPARRVCEDGSGIEDDEVWWVLSPDGDVWKERLDGEDPLTGPSGARPMPNVGYPLLGARRLYKSRERPSHEQIMTLSKGCRDVETARGQKLEQWPKYVIGDDGHRTELSAVLRAPRGDLAQLVDVSPPSDTIWVLMESGGGRAIGEEVHMTPTDVITGSDGLKFMGSEVSRVRRVGVGSAPALAIEQIARLRRAIDVLEPQDQLGLNTSETAGEAGSGEERIATSSVGDVRTLSVDFDGHGERFKAMYKSGGDPMRWLAEWSREHRIERTDRIYHELEVLCLSLGGLRSLERLARRIQAVDSLNWLAGASAGSSTTPVAAAQLDVAQRIDGQVNDVAQPMRGVGLQPPHSALRELMRGRRPRFASCFGGGRASAWMGQGERMLRGHESALEALERCPRAPFSEPSLVRSRRRYGDFVRDLAKRGLVSCARQVSETVGIFFAWSNAWLIGPPSVQLLTAEGLSAFELEEDGGAEGHLQAAFQAALKDVEFSAGVADVKGAFHRVRLPPWMKRLFGLPALEAGDVRLHGAMLEGKVLGYDDVIFPVPEALPMGRTWSLCLCQSVAELRCQFAPSLRDGAPLSDVGKPLVLRLAAGTAQIEHYVYVDNIGVIGQNGGRVSSSLDELAQAFEAVGPRVHGREVRCDGIEVLGVVLGGQRLQTRPTSKRGEDVALCVDEGEKALTESTLPRGDYEMDPEFREAVVDAPDTAEGSADGDGPFPSSGAIVGVAAEGAHVGESSRRATGKRARSAGESLGGATSESEAAVELKRRRTLVRLVKRRHLAVARAIEDGVSLDRYLRVVGQLKQRSGRQDFFEMPAETMDACLDHYFTSLYLLGKQASTGMYVAAAVNHIYPKFGRLGADTLRPGDIVKPGGGSQHWGLLMHPQERETPDKVGEFDLSVRLDSSWLRWIGPVLSEMQMLGPRKPVWDFDYPELLRKMKAACRRMQLRPVTPCQAGHSGASIDRASGERTQAEVRRRGGWRQLMNMARYEKSARLGQRAQMHGPMLEAYGDQCLRELEHPALAERCKALLIGDGLATIGSGLAESGVPTRMWRGDALGDERLGAPLERRLQAHLRRGEVAALFLSPAVPSANKATGRYRRDAGSGHISLANPMCQIVS